MPRPVNALIIDDEPHVRVLIKMLLKQLGIETIWEAADGTVGLDQATTHKPDVILLDINLPQMGGLEVLAKLKAALPTIPVIIVSSQSTMKTVIQTRELGAEAYILKHAPKSEVLQMLSDAFDAIAEGSRSGAAASAPAPVALTPPEQAPDQPPATPA